MINRTKTNVNMENIYQTQELMNGPLWTPNPNKAKNFNQSIKILFLKKPQDAQVKGIPNLHPRKVLRYSLIT